MNRRRWLRAGCAKCLWLAGVPALAQIEAGAFVMPERFARPDIASDEGGLWALMDREEQRIRRSPFRIRDEALQAYLQATACTLAQAHCPDVRVYALRTPSFNASMAPNGMMQVWSGLLLRMDNEAQLAAVMAHEIGHYLKRHSVEQLRDAQARSAFGTFMAMFGLPGALVSLAALAGAFGFTRDQEREADQIGLDLMERAGYDPGEAARVWAQLSAELAANAEVDPQRNNPMMATHPNSIDRSKVLAERAAGRSGEQREAAYQARLAPLRSTLLADELQRGRFDESLVLLDRLLAAAWAQAAAPGGARAELLYFRGETRRQRAKPGDADLALVDLEAAVAAGKEPAQTHRALGELHRSAERPEAARRSFERYLELAPEAADAGLVREQLKVGG
jgi:beta-barrel assembly-enhancing protease